MWPLRDPQLPPAALEVSPRAFRLLQLAEGAEGLRVVARVRRLFDAPRKVTDPALSRDLWRAHNSAPFTSRRVIAVLPDELVHYRTIRLRPASGEDLETRLRQEAADAFPFKLSGAIFRWLEAGTIRQGKKRLEVIVAAARRQEVAAFARMIAGAGLKLDSLRLAPFAAFRCARRSAAAHGRSPSAMMAIVEVAEESTTVLVARGSQISFLKRIPLGGRHLNEAVAQALALTPAEVMELRQRLTESNEADLPPRDGAGRAVFDATRAPLLDLICQVRACFRYHAVTFPGPQPTAIHLLGAEAADRHLLAALSAALPIEINRVDPFEAMDTTALRGVDRQRWSGEWTTCVGHALRGLAGEAVEADELESNETTGESADVPDSLLETQTMEIAHA